MARMPRIRVEGNEAWYHIHSHAAAKTGEFPLESEVCKSKLISLIEFYSKPYFCEVAGFNALGNHYHLVIHFEAARPLGEQQRWERALMLYPEKRIRRWNEADWTRFEKRLFNVSELMRNIQGSFATWYNKHFDRKGRFWGDRFKSTVLTRFEAVLQCLMYVDLNPVRAGVCKRPRAYMWSSHRYHAYGEYNRVVTPHAKYLALADSDRIRRRRYRRWFRREQTEDELAVMRGEVPKTARSQRNGA